MTWTATVVNTPMTRRPANSLWTSDTAARNPTTCSVISLARAAITLPSAVRLTPLPGRRITRLAPTAFSSCPNAKLTAPWLTWHIRAASVTDWVSATAAKYSN